MSEQTTQVVPGQLTSGMCLKQCQGEFLGQDDEPRYRLYTRMAGGQPMIYSVATSRTWTCTWAELLEMARAAGIDEPTELAVLGEHVG